MSISLMTAAWKTTLSATRKLVLLALCDNANDQGECYPSIPMIAEKCSLKERVVYECLKDLEVGGFVIRDARTGRSTLYRITNPCMWCTPALNAPLHNMQDTPAPRAPTPACSAPPPLHHMQVTPAPRAPITINEPSIEPSLNHKRDGAKAPRAAKTGREAAPSAVALPDWLPAASWEALLGHRKATKAAMTEQAQRLAIGKLDELRKQGNDPAEVINQSILNGWKGLFPIRGGQPVQSSQRQEKFDPVAFVNRNRKRSNNGTDGNIIDVTP